MRVNPNMLHPGDHILITYPNGEKRLELVQEVTEDELVTIGFANDAPVAQSIEEVELLNNPLYRKIYKLNKENDSAE